MSTNKLIKFYESSLLSKASYESSLVNYISQKQAVSSEIEQIKLLSKTLIQTGNFTKQEADYFANRFDIVTAVKEVDNDIFGNESEFGYAALFQNRQDRDVLHLSFSGTQPTQVSDLVTDIKDIALDIDGVNSDFDYVEAWARKLRTQGYFDGAREIHLGGHSLGAARAASLFMQMPDLFDSAIVVDLPGTGGLLANVWESFVALSALSALPSLSALEVLQPGITVLTVSGPSFINESGVTLVVQKSLETLINWSPWTVFCTNQTL